MVEELAKVFVIVGLFLIESAACGFFLLGFLGRGAILTSLEGNSYLKWFFAISVGISINLLVLFLLAALNIFYPSVVFATLGILCGFSLAYIYFSKQIKLCWNYGHFTLVMLMLFTCILFSAHPPGLWDDTSYQLLFARSYWQHHGLVVNEYLRFPLFPQAINLLISIGLFNGDEMLAQCFAVLPLFVIMLGIIGAAIWLSDNFLIGVAACISLLFINPFGASLGYAYIDCGFALFCWAATLAIAMRSMSDHKGYSPWLGVAGILAGSAIASKLFGIVFCAILGSYVLLVGRNLRGAIAFGAIAFAVGCGWYVRSYLISGDPIHPAGGNIFGYYLWNEADLQNQKGEQSTFGVDIRSFNIPAALISAGVGLWVVALFSLLFRGLPRAVKFLQYVFVLYLLFWFFVTQVDRYLAPICALAVFLGWYVIYRLYPLTWMSDVGSKLTHGYGNAIPIAISILMFSYMSTVKYQEGRNSLGQWVNILSSHPGVDLFFAANTLIPEYGDRMVHLSLENAKYFYSGTAIGDWFGPGRYSQMLDCKSGQCKVRSPADLKALLEKFNAKVFVLGTAMFPDFDRQEYESYFTFIKEDSSGILMVLK